MKLFYALEKPYFSFHDVEGAFVSPCIVFSVTFNLYHKTFSMMTIMKLGIASLAILLACSHSPVPEVPVDSADGGEAALTGYAQSLPLNTIKLPAGFKIDVFAEVPDARSMAI